MKMVQKLNFLQFYVFRDLVLRNNTNTLNMKYYFHLPKPQNNSDTDLYYVAQTFSKILIYNLLVYFQAHIYYTTQAAALCLIQCRQDSVLYKDKHD